MNIDYIFNHIDKDQSGSINAEELKIFLSENDVSYLEVDVNTILKELDKNGDGVITQDEFKECFQLLLDRFESN